MVLTATAGVDFLAALRTQREISAADEYTEESTLLDDTGVRRGPWPDNAADRAGGAASTGKGLAP